MFNTLPYNCFPASTAKFEEGKNDAIQAEIDAIKDGTNIDSFGDVETALSLKVNSADMETALATKTNLSNIAPTFDSESGTYDIGEQIIYEGVLYEFISAHDTPGDWDSTEVQAVKISELIDTLNSNLTSKQDATDNNLTTTNKTIVGGINELKSGLIDVAKIPTTSPESAITTVAGGANYTYIATSDGFLGVHAPLAEGAREFNVFLRDNNASKYGVSIYAKVPMYHGDALGGLFVKAGRTYYIDNVGGESVDVYLNT